MDKYTIFLDMDGVLSDFVGACGELFDFDPKTLNQWSIERHVGIEPKEFWGKIDRHSPRFWAEMEEYPWARTLYTYLRGNEQFGTVYICTTPSQSPDSLRGKMYWLQKRMGKNFRDYVLTPHKHLLAHPGAILIDDSPGNINKFREAGGQGIVFPQPWNWRSVADPVKESDNPTSEVPRDRISYTLHHLRKIIRDNEESGEPLEAPQDPIGSWNPKPGNGR